MYLKQINISNYKNISRANLEFSPKINCLIGLNGMGKTNLLDAIYYLSFLRGIVYLPENMIIQRNEQFCIIDASYNRLGSKEHLMCALQTGKPKVLKRNKKAYDRFSDHIGLFPLVVISPKDYDLIFGGSDERRKFLDVLISQESPDYLAAISNYKRLLEQRNSILKQKNANTVVLDVLDTQIATEAASIMKYRENWIEKISPIFSKYYNLISNNKEEVKIVYKQSFSEKSEKKILEELKRFRTKDFVLGHTSIGTHKDDLEMLLGEELVRKIGSQGQCKTFLIALKVAQYMKLKEICHLKPILLLDDIFDKLDATRVDKIVQMVTSQDFGQIFMSDTNRDFLDKILEQSAVKQYSLFRVEDGQFSLISHSDGE